MNKPELTGSFIFEDRKIEVEWFDTPSFEDVPNLPWNQVYAVGNLDGKVPLVFYADGHRNLPGGTTEPGESLENTLRRELIEEINCRVKSFTPLGFQKLYDPLTTIPIYQMRVYAELEKIADFEKDSGGTVIGYELVNLEEVNTKINYGDIGQRMMSIVGEYYGLAESP